MKAWPGDAGIRQADEHYSALESCAWPGTASLQVHRSALFYAEQLLDVPSFAQEEAYKQEKTAGAILCYTSVRKVAYRLLFPVRLVRTSVCGRP